MHTCVAVTTHYFDLIHDFFLLQIGSQTKSFLKSKKPASADSSGKVKPSDNLGSSKSPRGKLSKHSVVKKGKPDRSKGKAGRDVCSVYYELLLCLSVNESTGKIVSLLCLVWSTTLLIC